MRRNSRYLPLSETGSILVQISDENLSLVHIVLAEVFGTKNYVVHIPVKKKGGQKGGLLDPINDYLIWYAKDRLPGGVAAWRRQEAAILWPIRLPGEDGGRMNGARSALQAAHLAQSRWRFVQALMPV